jgi:Deacetylase PdaC
MKMAKILLATVLLAAQGIAAKPKMIETQIKGKGYEFDYSYPSIAAQIPQLKKRIEKDKAKELYELQAMTKGFIADQPQRAKAETFSVSAGWETVTNLPGYLSLTYSNWSYTGGAHGNWWRSSVVWDRKEQKLLDPLEMFGSKAAFDEEVQTQYCDLLDAERSERRGGEKIDRSQGDDWMQACPKPSELVVILGSSDGKTFNRMSVYAAPYAVGPYSEADYEIGLPITSQLLGIVKPAYRSSFAVTRDWRRTR